MRKIGAYEYEIVKAKMGEIDAFKLGTQARLIPNYRGGKYEGFKLVGVRPGSLYRAIGIRSGDIVRKINGAVIDSPGKAFLLVQALRQKSKIVIDMERRRKPVRIRIRIR